MTEKVKIGDDVLVKLQGRIIDEGKGNVIVKSLDGSLNTVSLTAVKVFKPVFNIGDRVKYGPMKGSVVAIYGDFLWVRQTGTSGIDFMGNMRKDLAEKIYD